MADDDRHAGYRNALSQHFRILTMKLQPMATAITNITLAIQNACQSMLATPTSAIKLTGMNVNS